MTGARCPRRRRGAARPARLRRGAVQRTSVRATSAAVGSRPSSAWLASSIACSHLPQLSRPAATDKSPAREYTQNGARTSDAAPAPYKTRRPESTHKMALELIRLRPTSISPRRSERWGRVATTEAAGAAPDRPRTVGGRPRPGRVRRFAVPDRRRLRRSDLLLARQDLPVAAGRGEPTGTRRELDDA